MDSTPKRPLRIALVIARLNIGGPATHVIELAAGLPRERFSVRLFSGRVGRSEGGMQYLAQERGIQPEEIASLSPHLGARDLPAFLHLRRIFREWKPDVVHTHTAKAGALGRAAARSAGVPVVVHTFHGHVLRGYFSPPAEAFFRAIEQALARSTDRIVTLSRILKNDLVEMRIAPPEKIEVVPLGMDLSPFLASSARRGELRKELGMREGEPLIGIIGRLVPIKNHRLFLEAARSMVDSGAPARFVVVGDGELRESLESLAAEWDLAQRIHFLGWRKDMAPVYAALDVLALTSVNEGTPVAVIEAMAAGIPVVATAVGGVPDTIRDGETGWLVPPGDAGAIHHAWLAALVRSAANRQILDRARREAIDRFGSERMIATMSDLYVRLAEEKRATSHTAN
jgi:glycosyltransferase involved in cell wall biosynthesis